MRLTTWTLTENSILQESEGAPVFVCDTVSPALVVRDDTIPWTSDAPVGLLDQLVRSTATLSVDNAGWAEVVIPKGPRVLSNRSTGDDPVNVAASIDCSYNVSLMNYVMCFKGDWKLPAEHSDGRFGSSGVMFPCKTSGYTGFSESKRVC